MSRALLLPGGASHGVIQAGMIYGYMKQVGWTNPYDALYGTSAGTLNGVLLHQGEFDKLLELWRNIKSKDVYHWNPLKFFGKAGALSSSKPLSKLVDRYLNIEKLRANPKPFYVSATCVNPVQAETRQIPCNDTKTWIMASSAAPIAFPTQFMDGKQYTDGGISRNYNIEKAIADGHDEIVVLAPSTIREKNINSGIDMLELQMSAQAVVQFDDETEIARLLNKSQHTVTLTIYKPTSVDLGQLDFDSASKNFDKYFRLGYELLDKPLIKVRRLIKPV